MIFSNELRSTLSSWSDRLIACAALLIALAAARSALSDKTFVFAGTVIVAVGVVAGAGVARLIVNRLDFHTQEGVLAAEALTHATQRRYALSVHIAACALLTISAAIARPSATVLLPVGYLIGAGTYHSVIPALTDISWRRLPLTRNIKPLLHRPVAGAMAAASLLPLLLLRSIAPGPMAAFIGLVTALVALMLATLDYNVVRFMTESGYSAGRIIGIHARSPLMFGTLSVLASLIFSNGLVAIVILSVDLAVLALMSARVLAYRTHSKRVADLLLSICAGVACLTGIAMPMLLPFVMIAILWHLYRRSSRATWLLA